MFKNNYICFNKNKSFIKEVATILKNGERTILDFFEVEDNSKCVFNVYVYNTIEDLVTEMKNRGFKDMPNYMCACYKDEDNSINLFEPKDNPSSTEWSKEEYKDVIFHEEIHAIQNAIYGIQPEWLTEGIAKYLDGTYKKGIKFLLENYINNDDIPSMNELINEFGFHEYDSYDYAYLCVSYLIDIYGKSNFLKIIKHSEKIDEISEDLINKAINYYNNKFYDNDKN